MTRTLITRQSLLVFAMLISANLLAESPKANPVPPFRSSCYVNKASQIRLAIDKSTIDVVSVVLRRDGEKLAIVTKYAPKKQSKLVYVFDVDELPDGLYMLELSDGQAVVTHQVAIATNEQPGRRIALHR